MFSSIIITCTDLYDTFFSCPYGYVFLQAARSDLVTQDEDPFDSLTDKIPQKPVTFVEGASYSFIILIGFAVAGFAAYGVFKELIFEPKE
mgnify:CR=1 FL=1